MLKDEDAKMEEIKQDPEAEDQALFEEFLKTLNMTKCPCGNMMELERGSADFT